MYEMQRPRPVSRHRPADCSASFAPLDRLPGAVTLTGAPVARITSGSGVPLAGWVRVFSLPTARGCPRAGAAKFLFAGGSECRLWPVARGFPFAGWLGASSHLRPEISPCRVAPGPPRPVARGFPLPVAPDLSGPEGPQMPRCRVAPSPPRPMAQGFPLPGGSGFLRARRPADTRCRVARGWPLAGGPEFPLCRRLRVSLAPAGARKSHCRVAPESPLASGQRPFLCRVAPGFPPLPVA